MKSRRPVMKRRPPARRQLEIGWRELIALPALGVPAMPAKIDTGARTSALHADEIEPFERDGAAWVTFTLPVGHRGRRYTTRLAHERRIKNTGGHWERRPIIETTIVLGEHRWVIEVSLTNREKMEFDLILGRTAIRRNRIVVNPRRSFIVGTPIVSPADESID